MGSRQLAIGEAVRIAFSVGEVAAPFDLDWTERSRVRQYLRFKGVLDFVGAIVGIAFFLPFLLVGAFLIKLTSPGPVLFRQWRAGKNGVPFRIYKLRTMQNGAHLKKKELAALNEQDGPAFKLTNDPRITRVGKFLRKTSFDEAPQFLNVLLGHMSIVGPRPLPVDEAEQLAAEEQLRHLVKPGLTCFWQVQGRNSLSFREWMEKDRRYVRDCRLAVDIDIVVRTFRAVAQLGGK